MTRRIIPHATTAAVSGTVMADGEVVIDDTLKQLRIGDGETAGGRLVPTINWLPTIDVRKFSHLVVARTAALRGVASTGWIGVSYDDWMPAIRAAFEYAQSIGGGEVLLPYRTDPYYVSDVFYIYSRTTFNCQGKIALANSTTGGGIFGTASDTEVNCAIYDLKLDGSNLYTGGSGENGIGFGGTGHKLIGGEIINCKSGNNNDGTGDGGKAVQNETEFSRILVSGLTVKNCMVSLSTRQEHIAHAYNCGPQIFTGITAEDCPIFFFVEYAGVGSVPDGVKHSVILDGFSARNCGTFEGAMQFSNAGNVLVANGQIINTGFTTPAFIRGRHRYCTFDNLQFSGNCTSIINNSPGTYCALTASSEQNKYDYQHTGTIATMMGSSAASDRAITNSTVTARIDTDPTSGLIDSDVKDTTTHCEITFDGKVLRGSSTFIATYYATFAGVDWAGDVIGNCAQGEWTPTITSSAGTTPTIANVAGLFRKVGRDVALFLTFDITANNTGSGYLILSTTGLPASVTPPQQGTTGTWTENNAAALFGYIYNIASGGNPLGMFKHDGTYPGVTNGKYSCVIRYSMAS